MEGAGLLLQPCGAEAADATDELESKHVRRISANTGRSAAPQKSRHFADVRIAHTTIQSAAKLGHNRANKLRPTHQTLRMSSKRTLVLAFVAPLVCAPIGILIHGRPPYQPLMLTVPLALAAGPLAFLYGALRLYSSPWFVAVCSAIGVVFSASLCLLVLVGGSMAIPAFLTLQALCALAVLFTAVVLRLVGKFVGP